MNDTYVECLVARKANPAAPLIKAAAIGVTAAFILFGLLMRSFIFILPGIAAGVASFLFLPCLSLEYEYLLAAGEFSVDKIMSKENRKNVLNLTLDKLEIFAEEGSYQLDNYKNQNMTVKDFSSGEEGRRRFEMIFRNDNGLSKLILEPSDDLIEAMRFSSPGKVFINKSL